MLLKQLTRIAYRTPIRNIRECSYKPIKRPDFNATSKKVFVDKKLKDFNLQQILRAKIQMAGPITGELSEDETENRPHRENCFLDAFSRFLHERYSDKSS